MFNIYFSDVKTIISHKLCLSLHESLIPQAFSPQVYNAGKWLENIALFEYCYILFLASEAF